MVRRKIEIKLIENKSNRHTTFTKRRKGLMKKTEEFSKKTNSKAAVIVFSKAGNCYVLGHPDVHSVLDRYSASDSSSSSAAAASAASPLEQGTSAASEIVHGDEEKAAAAPPPTEFEKRIGAAVETGRWEEAVKGLGLQGLDELFAEVENIRRKLVARGMKIAAAAEEECGGDSSRSTCRD